MTDYPNKYNLTKGYLISSYWNTYVIINDDLDVLVKMKNIANGNDSTVHLKMLTDFIKEESVRILAKPSKLTNLLYGIA